MVVVVVMDSYTIASGWTASLLWFGMTSRKHAVVGHCKHPQRYTYIPTCAGTIAVLLSFWALFCFTLALAALT